VKKTRGRKSRDTVPLMYHLLLSENFGNCKYFQLFCPESATCRLKFAFEGNFKIDVLLFCVDLRICLKLV
jgi:Pyruvate/2-oxoacid:ferredoxin oxidoreductase delta subunit